MIESRYWLLISYLRDLDVAERRSQKLAEARAALPPGTSRARVTTVNARWMRAAEARDRRIEDVRYQLSKLPELKP